MNNESMKIPNLWKNTHRSFAQAQDSDFNEENEVQTRTKRAQDAVKRAQEIVSKNNQMVEALKKKNNILESESL